MKKKMKAIVKKFHGKGLQIEKVPVPEPGINDVIVKVHKTAICGTDVHIYNWDSWAEKTIHPPIIVGHEFAGTVAAMGSNVHDLKIGDVVSGEGHIVCGRCRNCLAGRRHLCKDTSGIGINRDGCFAEYVKIPITNIWHASPDIPMDILSIFDPFGNAVHAALSFKTLGEDVLITGAGPIGLMATAVVKHAGARYIVVTDTNPYRLKLAKKMGATITLKADGEKILKDVQEELGMKEGFDVGLEMSGSGRALNEMIENMCHGGRIALLGILPENLTIDWHKIIFNMITIKGIYGREMYETWYMMESMLQTGLDITPVITHHFHYTDFEKAFEVILSGRCGKVILNWID